MAFKFLDRTRETTATTGAGNITFGGAVSGYVAFSAGLANGDTTPYAIADGANYEEGVLTYISASNTCSRAVSKSSNANAAIVLSGSAVIFSTLRASDIGTGANNLVQLDTAAKLPAVDGSQLTGVALQGKNKLINGGMRVDQRNAGNSQTFTAAAALAYCVDRWYGYCTGANVTGQQISGAGNTPNYYRFTGAAAVTKIGFAQRIEAANAYELAGLTATLSVDLANSLLTTVTWTAYYANSVNAFGTLASPTRTQIATGTFTVNSTVTRYSTQISVPAGATAGVEIELSVAAQTSGTWDIGKVQLEAAPLATSFERTPYGLELLQCQRYFSTNFPSGTKPADNVMSVDYFFSAYTTGEGATQFIPFACEMRASPTMTYFSSVQTVSPPSGQWQYFNGGWLNGNTTVNLIAGVYGFSADFKGTFTANNSYISAGGWTASAEL